MQFNPSPQQIAIGDFIHTPHGPNLIIEAVAGSGKTTTIVWATSLIPARLPGQLLNQNIVFLAFNKAIAETLQGRCPKHVQCSTFHSLGFRALKQVLDSKVKVESRKCSKILYSLTDRNDPDFQAILRLVGLFKAVGLGCDFCDEAPSIIADRFNIAFVNPSSIGLAEKVLSRSNHQTNEIDFDDMLYLPLLLNAPFQTRDWIFIDEAQDTNEVQVEILDRLCKKRVAWEGATISGTRLVAVGDPLQSIYGFRGANSSAMDRIAARFSCTPLPLSVSYRCPQAIVEEVRRRLATF